MPTAREVVMAEIRQARNQKLNRLDDEINTKTDQGQDVTALRVYRQALRDFPAVAQADCDSLETPEELNTYRAPWPTKP